jgi:hypothetical protein
LGRQGRVGWELLPIYRDAKWRPQVASGDGYLVGFEGDTGRYGRQNRGKKATRPIGGEDDAFEGIADENRVGTGNRVDEVAARY